MASRLSESFSGGDTNAPGGCSTTRTGASSTVVVAVDVGEADGDAAGSCPTTCYSVTLHSMMNSLAHAAASAMVMLQSHDLFSSKTMLQDRCTHRVTGS
jgi:hypothetical protein